MTLWGLLVYPADAGQVWSTSWPAWFVLEELGKEASEEMVKASQLNDKTQ